MFPNGRNDHDKDFISVYLENVNFEQLICKSNLQVLYNVGIQRQCGRKDYMKTVDTLLKLERFESVEGYDKFMSHNELFDPVNAFIIDGKLTLFSQVNSVVIFIVSIRFSIK